MRNRGVLAPAGPPREGPSGTCKAKRPYLGAVSTGPPRHLRLGLAGRLTEPGNSSWIRVSGSTLRAIRRSAAYRVRSPRFSLSRSFGGATAPSVGHTALGDVFLLKARPILSRSAWSKQALTAVTAGESVKARAVQVMTSFARRGLPLEGALLSRSSQLMLCQSAYPY